MFDDLVAYAVVAVFAVVNGANDGGVIVAIGLRSARTRPWLRVVVLVTVFAVAPLLFGSRVAVTLAERLVVFEGDVGRVALLAAILASLLVVWALASRGLPTSLTLGLIGAVAGAGVGSGLAVGWRTLGFVLLIGVVAPVIGLLGAMLLHVATRPWLGAVPAIRRAVPSLGHLLQSVAYGANDGQKMLAVLAITVGTAATVTAVPTSLWALVVACFAAGTVVGVARVGPTIDARVLPLRIEDASLAQLAGAGAVLGSAAVATPVSLIQATTGGLVGAGMSVTARRVRWAPVGHLAVAWLVTLPAAFLTAALLAAAAGVVT